MKLCLLVLLACTIVNSETADYSERSNTELNRQKRSLYDFGRMVLALTGLDAVRFNGHGNYCGVGGNGNVTDSLDL
ncbi:Uncharacterised protein r2_g2194 [Pycnogonum litorale]